MKKTHNLENDKDGILKKKIELTNFLPTSKKYFKFSNLSLKVHHCKTVLI